MKVTGGSKSKFVMTALVGAVVAVQASVASATIVDFNADSGYAADSTLIGKPSSATVKWSGNTDANNTFFVRTEGSGQVASTVAGKHNVYANYHPTASDLGIAAGQTLSTSIVKYSFDVRINGALEAEVNYSALTSLRARLGSSDGGASAGNFELSSAGYFRYSDGTTNGIKAKTAANDIVVAPANTFVTISGEINFANSTYTLFVDGVQQKGKNNNTVMTFTSSVTDLFYSMKQLTNPITDPASGIVYKGNATFSVDNLKMEAVPEAASLGLLGAGATALLMNRRK